MAGLGYDLVATDRSAGGLLRITIDLPWPQVQGGSDSEQLVTIEDCEKVTRQLQFALEVDGIEYKRLEVSSPGIDRPLRHEQDFERFVGRVIDITLKAAMGAAAQGLTSASRKNFAAGWSAAKLLAAQLHGKLFGLTSPWSNQGRG